MVQPGPFPSMIAPKYHLSNTASAAFQMWQTSYYTHLAGYRAAQHQLANAIIDFCCHRVRSTTASALICSLFSKSASKMKLVQCIYCLYYLLLFIIIIIIYYLFIASGFEVISHNYDLSLPLPANNIFPDSSHLKQQILKNQNEIFFKYQYNRVSCHSTLIYCTSLISI